MNGQPHTHQIEIKRQFSDNTGGWRIVYGDTKVRMFNLIHFLNKEGALKRKVAKAIRRHDRGSVKAVKKAQMIERIQAIHNEVLVTQTRNWPYHSSKEAWGSELLRQPNPPQESTLR